MTKNENKYSLPDLIWIIAVILFFIVATIFELPRALSFTILFASISWTILVVTKKSTTKLNTVLNGILFIKETKTKEDIIKKVTSDVLKVFGFDYVVLSLVSKVENKETGIFSNLIKGQSYSASNNISVNNKVHPEHWYEKFEYLGADTDILVDVLKYQKEILVAGKYIIDDTKGENKFNEKIYSDYKHEKLGRFYFPLFIRNKYDETDSILGNPIGVVECGFYTPIINRLFVPFLSNELSSKLIFKKFYGFTLSLYTYFFKGYTIKHYRSLGNLYFENLAQGLNKFNQKNNFDALETIIIESNLSNENHNHYAQQVLNNISKQLRAAGGIICFNSLNLNYYSFEQQSYFCELGLGNLKPETDYEKLVINNGEDPTYTILNKEFLSEFIIPIERQSNEIVGYVIFYSNQKGYFNILDKHTLQKIFKYFLTFYNRKKRNSLYSSLVKPINLKKEGKNGLYFNIAYSLSTYFNCEQIIIWEKDFESFKKIQNTNDRFAKFNLINLSTQKNSEINEKEFIDKNSIFRNEYSEFGTLNNFEIFYDESKTNVELILRQDSKGKFGGFMDKNKLFFYILIRVRLNSRNEVFINILSKNDLFNKKNNSLNSITYLKREMSLLGQISNLITLNLQNFNYFEAINQVTDVLFDEPKDKILEQIGTNAMIASGADNVVIYPYSGGQIYTNQGTFVGIIEEKYRIVNLKRESSPKIAVIANLIIKKDKEDYFWNSSKDFVDSVSEELPAIKDNIGISDGFWGYNNIESAAAIPVKYKGYPVGVIFFNYRVSIDFDNGNLKGLIKEFSQFVGIHLRNINVVENIEEKLIEYEKTKIILDQKTIENRKTEILLQRVIDENEELIQNLKKLEEKAPFGTTWFAISHSIKHFINFYTQNLSEYILKNFDPKSSLNFQKFEIQMEKYKQISKYVDRLLNLFQEGTIKESSFDLNKVIIDEVEFIKSNHTDIAFDLALNEIPMVYFAIADFSVIFFNILKNSTEAIESKWLNSSSGYFGNIKIKSNFDNNKIIISFKDNGIGIKKDDISGLGVLGKTTKPTGTGIGLYFIKKTIENKYKGKVQILSSYLESTEIIIQIPIKH